MNFQWPNGLPPVSASQTPKKPNESESCGNAGLFGAAAGRELPLVGKDGLPRMAIMKLKLHHIDLSSTEVPAMDASPVTNQGYAGDVAFCTDGTTQVHLAE